MKPSIRKIGLERMQILIKNATSLTKSNPQLAQRYAFLAKKISTLRQKKGTFSSANELLEVSGIGPRKLRVIKKYLAFN